MHIHYLIWDYCLIMDGVASNVYINIILKTVVRFVIFVKFVILVYARNVLRNMKKRNINNKKKRNKLVMALKNQRYSQINKISLQKT